MNVPLIPRDVLFGNPTRDNPRIAPDGTRLAYLAPVDDVLAGAISPVTPDTLAALGRLRDKGVL